MIEGSSGESDVSGEAPSIRLTISRIFKRFHHFYRLTDISAFLNEGFFILQHNLHQDSPPSDGSSRFPFLHPILLWVEHGQLLHDHHLPGLVWSNISQRRQQTNFIRWQTSLWMRTLPLSLWRHNMSSDTGDPSILNL